MKDEDQGQEIEGGIWTEEEKGHQGEGLQVEQTVRTVTGHTIGRDISLEVAHSVQPPSRRIETVLDLVTVKI